MMQPTDPKLLHFKYHYPVFYRLHSQIRSHSLTQSHMTAWSYTFTTVTLPYQILSNKPIRMA